MATGTTNQLAIGRIHSASCTISYSVNANSTVSINPKSYIDNEIPTGGAFLCLKGWTTNNSNCYVSALRYADSQYALQIHNTTSSALSNQSMRIDFLYYL